MPEFSFLRSTGSVPNVRIIHTFKNNQIEIGLFKAFYSVKHLLFWFITNSVCRLSVLYILFKSVEHTVSIIV